jgi:acetoacetyl-CoA synthetase
MWNIQIMGLACGTRIILYDGSPFHPDLSTYLKFINDQGYQNSIGDLTPSLTSASVTALGSSPRFLAEILGQGIKPCNSGCLGHVGPLIVAKYSSGHRKV